MFPGTVLTSLVNDLWIFVVLHWVFFLDFMPCSTRHFTEAMENSKYCPPGYHMSAHAGVNESSRICRFCPNVSCFIAKGLGNGDLVMSCARLHELPRARDVLVYLPCVIIGDNSKNLYDVFIYYPKSHHQIYEATCINRNFLQWIVEEKLQLRVLELGFSTQDLSHPSFLMEYHRTFSQMEYLCIQTSVDLTKESLTRWDKTLLQLKVLLKKDMHPGLPPSIKGVEQCIIRPKQILHLNESCYVNANEKGFPKSALAKHKLEHGIELCDYERPKKTEEHESDILESNVQLCILLGLIVGLVVVIGSFILIYYIRNHSRFSAHKRQARLEKKRAIDMYMRQNYPQNAKLST